MGAELTSIILKHRRANKISQDTMAKFIGVRRETYIQYEKTGRMPLDSFMSICGKLGLSVLVIEKSNIF